MWLRADRQTGGRGRQGRAWASPVGNLYASTLVRVRSADPAPATLALVAAIALGEAIIAWQSDASSVMLKWPNDVLVGSAKVSGILLERTGDAVVVGIGVNLASHPDLADRPTTSLAAHGIAATPAAFLETLAERMSAWRDRWRAEGLGVVRARWLAMAHAVGTPLTARLSDGEAIAGTFDGLAEDGALILRLAQGERRVIHAADVFLL